MGYSSGHARRSACTVRWNPRLTALQVKKQKSVHSHSFIRRAKLLVIGTCLQQPPATIDWHSRAESIFYMKSPTKHKWWAESSVAKLWSSLRNSFPELRGNSPWPLATENYLQKQYVKISNWSQIHLKDKQPIKAIESWTGHNHKVNKHKGTKNIATISLELGDQLLLNLVGPSGLGLPFSHGSGQLSEQV